MEKLELEYRNCDQQFKSEFDSNQYKHLKRMNLSINLPTSQEQNPINLTPKLLTPVVSNFLHFNDELKNQSPILFKESNPFAETFKQAALEPFNDRSQNFDDQGGEVANNESLNTPSIDLKCFEPRNNSAPNSSKLDLLISASNEQALQIFDDQTNGAGLMDTDKAVLQQKTRTKRILPKLERDDVPAYKVFLKLPDGSSVSIPTENIVSNYSQPTNAQIDTSNTSSPQPANKTSLKLQSISKSRRNSRATKSKQTERVETTTLKSIKTALADSTTSHPQFEGTADMNRYDSINSCSQSSQSSTTSLYGLSSKEAMDDNSNSAYPDLAMSSASSSQSSTLNSDKASGTNSKSRSGRKVKNQSKEDPNEKKSRSLKRNREAASRCRTKRKIWENALEEKANELEKKNKELAGIYEKLKHEVQQMKAALLNDNKTSALESTSTNAQETFTQQAFETFANQAAEHSPIQNHNGDMFTPSIRSNSFDVLLQAAAKNSQNNQDFLLPSD